MTSTSSNLDLITAFANLAREPHVLPTPARIAELDAMRRGAQRWFNVDGLPRGLRVVA